MAKKKKEVMEGFEGVKLSDQKEIFTDSEAEPTPKDLSHSDSVPVHKVPGKLRKFT